MLDPHVELPRLGGATRNSNAWLLLPLAFALVACHDDPRSATAPESELTASQAASDLRPDRGTIDDRWAAVSRGEVPGFAGIYLDRTTGEIVVSATRPEADGAARGFAQTWRATSDVPRAPIRFEVVDHDFDQLRRWKVAAEPLLGHPEVRFTDADEVRNRLVVGISSREPSTDLRQQLRSVQIPDAGVEFVLASPVVTQGGGALPSLSAALQGAPNVRQTLRPTLAGTSVAAQDPEQAPCTLGLNTTYSGESGSAFVSASHCSTDPFDPDIGFWHQNAIGPRVGQEAEDATPWAGVHFFEFQAVHCSVPCRFSDASLVAYDDTVSVGQGRIARTMGPPGVGGPGSIVLDDPNYRSVTQKRHLSNLVVGLVVDKMGRTSGWTRGAITATCLDLPADLDRPQRMCQYEADYWSDPGDSGGPVWVPLAGGDASLAGTVVGLRASNNKSLFSTVAGIEHDLGVTLDVCGPGGCGPPPPPALEVTVDGDTEVRDNTTCTWTADATGGVPPYSYEWFRNGDPVESGGESEAEYEADTGHESFELRVEVADSESGTTAWEATISVSSSHPLCDGGVQN